MYDDAEVVKYLRRCTTEASHEPVKRLLRGNAHLLRAVTRLLARQMPKRPPLSQKADRPAAKVRAKSV